MNDQSKNEAFDAIHDAALSTLKYLDEYVLDQDAIQQVRDKLHLIISLSRYRYDVRSIQERQEQKENGN